MSKYSVNYWSMYKNKRADTKGKYKAEYTNTAYRAYPEHGLGIATAKIAKEAVFESEFGLYSKERKDPFLTLIQLS